MRLIFVTLIFVSLSVLAGCKRSQVTYYEIPKELEEHPAMQEMPPSHPPAGNSNGIPSITGMVETLPEVNLSWKIPEGWVERSDLGIRLASCGIEGADKASFDFSVTRFPGAVGGVLSNVNRWRGQIGLGPMTTQMELEEITERMENAGLQFQLFRMAGEDEQALATQVAILEMDSYSWFFKMTGVKPLVERESERFLDFIRSVQPKGNNA